MTAPAPTARDNGFARAAGLRLAVAIAFAGPAASCGLGIHSDTFPAPGTTGDATGTSTTTGPAYLCDEGEGEALYEKRIAPLLETDRPKSCNQCHLSGIDLAIFSQPTACQTMACLASKDLVSLDDPASSVILQWIERAEPESELITPAVIQEEYDGFLSWIEQEAACGPCGEESEEEPEVCEFDEHPDPRRPGDRRARPGRRLRRPGRLQRVHPRGAVPGARVRVARPLLPVPLRHLQDRRAQVDHHRRVRARVAPDDAHRPGARVH